jgi:hypothetical protein
MKIGARLSGLSSQRVLENVCILPPCPAIFAQAEIHALVW